MMLITLLFLRVEIRSRMSYAVVQPASLSCSLHSANFTLYPGLLDPCRTVWLAVILKVHSKLCKRLEPLMADDCADGCGLWKWHLVASQMSFTAHVTTHECSGQNVASAVEFMQNQAFWCHVLHWHARCRRMRACEKNQQGFFLFFLISALFSSTL